MTGYPPPTTSLTRALHNAPPEAGLPGLSAADCATALGLDGLTVALISPAGPTELVWHDPADPVGPALDDLQFTLGEGPTADVARTGLAALQDDLNDTSAARWPMFTPAALDLGARTLIALPLALGAIRLGVLTGHRTVPGALTTTQRGDVVALTNAISFLALTAPEATVGLHGSHTDHSTLHRAEVHQATGVIATRQSLPLQTALLRLRAYAYSHDRDLLAVARAVLDGTLRHLNNGSSAHE
ncbi:ANTAR domain-containing protein [Streptomyces sp. AN091965]|uniref:ANTAR domain-containing protein n=1 Tax=Streptomyces sp. AN091965 TaxID=2927803 RepID=UPI001F5FFFEC|nr:ANTAR domain-containing protein [Streptomyces sp. AN091965]MCI3928339.1 ANTAR domain-containing protein [Streptomyces sp. AN091965]